MEFKSRACARTGESTRLRYSLDQSAPRGGFGLAGGGPQVVWHGLRKWPRRTAGIYAGSDCESSPAVSHRMLPETVSRLPRLTAELPRLKLAQLPTPLEEARRLSEALGGPRILFKRDDLTGVALGGNKVRKLEFVIGRAVAEGADSLVVCGGFQSNLARIAAAIGNRLGLRVVLVLGGEPGEPRELNGNLLLDHLYGVTVHTVDTIPRWDFGTAVQDVADDLRRHGARPFVIPLGGSGPEGMAGYVNATEELMLQLAEMNVRPSRLYVAV